MARSSMDESMSTDGTGEEGTLPTKDSASNALLPPAEGRQRLNSMSARSHSPGLCSSSTEDHSPGVRPKSMFTRGTHSVTVDGMKSDLPVRLKAICSLLVFVKNMEVSSDINIGRNTLKSGSSR